jgi:hypothetical protein
MGLVGTLLGSAVVNFWAEKWGKELTQRFGGGSTPTLTMVTSITVFALTVLIVGYGCGILFDRTKELSSFSQGLASTLLGMLNGALIIGYMLLYATANDPALRATVRSSLTGRIFSEGLPWLFLGITLTIATIVIVRFSVFIISARRSHIARQEQPSTIRPMPKLDQLAPKQPPPSIKGIDKSQAAQQTQIERDAIEKIRQRLSS